MTSIKRAILARVTNDDSEGTKIVVNAVAVLKGKSQTTENGIIRCTFVLFNFSMWAKLLNHSTVNLS